MFSLQSLWATFRPGSLAFRQVATPNAGPSFSAVRFRSQLAPRQVQHVKRHKGRVPIPIGGSTKGTTLAYGEWGIRIKGMGVRFSAKQLTTAEEVIKRKIKVVKGAKVYLRVFPDIPVCVKVCIVFVFYQRQPIPMNERGMKLVWVRGKGRSSSGLLGEFCSFALARRSCMRSVPTGRVIFEIGGTPIREELAREGRIS